MPTKMRGRQSVIELLKAPVVIPGRVPSMSNIAVNFRTLKMPLEAIKNPRTRMARIAYDQAGAWKANAAALILAGAKLRAPGGTAVFVYARLALHSAPKQRDPTKLLQDVDNPSKAIMDSLQRSGVIANDRQVVCLLLDKACGGHQPAVTLVSVCAAHPEQQMAWLRGLTRGPMLAACR